MTVDEVRQLIREVFAQLSPDDRRAFLAALRAQLEAQQ